MKRRKGGAEQIGRSEQSRGMQRFVEELEGRIGFYTH